MIFITGKSIKPILDALTRPASTEPVIFITGKDLAYWGWGLRAKGFNGAGDLHHRKALATATDECVVYFASTEPVIFITGKRSRASGRRRTPAGFNGAGDLHHRKDADPTWRIVWGRRFNGAGDLHHRKVQTT